MGKRMMWAVGPQDAESGWIAVDAPSDDDAVAAYCKEHDCSPDYIHAVRIPKWDALDKVTPADWFSSGEGTTTLCCECRLPTSDMHGGVICDGKILCEECKPREIEDDDA